MQLRSSRCKNDTSVKPKRAAKSQCNERVSQSIRQTAEVGGKLLLCRLWREGYIFRLTSDHWDGLTSAHAGYASFTRAQ